MVPLAGHSPAAFLATPQKYVKAIANSSSGLNLNVIFVKRIDLQNLVGFQQPKGARGLLNCLPRPIGKGFAPHFTLHCLLDSPDVI